MKKNKKKGGKVSRALNTVIMLVALCVFLYSGYQLVQIYLTYKEGSDEYAELSNRFAVDFDEEAEAGEGGSQRSGEGTDGADGAGAAQSGRDGADTPGETLLDNKEDNDSVNAERGKQNGKGDPDDEEITEREPETEGFTERQNEEGETVRYPVMRNPIDFEGLQEVNEDVIAWLRVPGIKASYPVAQGEDNEYYLHTTFERQENIAGCLFISCTNDVDFADDNTIIYGHNMKNGSMFGKLKQYGYEDAYEKYKYFWVYTPEFIHRYRIFSCSVVQSEGETYRENFGEGEFLEFVDKMRERSLVDGSKVKITDEDKIVTLSTCTGDEATRFILQGVEDRVYLSKGYQEKAKEEESDEG